MPTLRRGRPPARCVAGAATTRAALCQCIRRRVGVRTAGRGDRAASLVVQPATVDEVREVVRRAYAADIRLLPAGRQHRPGRGLGAAGRTTRSSCCRSTCSPAQPDVDVDQRPRSSPPAPAVGAQRGGAAHGLQLPIDLAADPAIGGMIATNTGGNRMLRYGPMRRYVLGVELVAADADAIGVRTAGRRPQGQPRARPGAARGRVRRNARRDHASRAVALVPLPRSVETWWLALDDPSTAAPSCYRRYSTGAGRARQRLRVRVGPHSNGRSPCRAPGRTRSIAASCPRRRCSLEVSSDDTTPRTTCSRTISKAALNEGLASEACSRTTTGVGPAPRHQRRAADVRRRPRP